jgi:outer membrane protein assembly factor BamE
MMRRPLVRSPMVRSLIRTLCAATLAAVLVAGCGFTPRIPGVTPYRIEIQQGNYIAQEMMAQLKPGMTKEQVRFILGTPLVTDIFHSDRWDYVYWRETPAGARERRNLTVLFEQGQLARVDGDVVPSGGQTQ